MQGHLKQIAQVHVQLSSEYIHRLKFHNLSPQPFPVFDHSHSKKVEFRIFKFVSIIYCPVSGLHWLPHFLSFLPIKYLSTLSLLFSRLNWFRLTELIRLSSYSWCSSPFIASVVLCWTFASKSICPAVGSPELDSALKTWPHQCCVEGKDHLPQPVDNYLCNAAQDTDGLFLLQGCIAGLWSAYFLPQCTLQSCKRQSSPSIYLCLELFFPICTTWHCLLFNFMHILSAHFSSLSRILWMAVRSSGISRSSQFCLQTCW